MAYDWEHVEAIRAAQTSARERFNQNVIAGDSMAADIRTSPGGKETDVRDLDSWDVKLFKLKSQLIDYIIEHGLVQGFNWDGTDYPIQNGKVVITEEMIKMVTDRFGYFTEKETLAFVEKYLPEHHYVSDPQYVHTDNNYTTEEKKKLEGIEAGAQVNAILDVVFNGNTVLDPETKVATIAITPEMVKEWYESNEDTNVFTDAEKAKLNGIDTGALANKVEDVTLDGETIVKNKVAALTAKKIKDSYESNPDTNAFTDGDKVLVETTIPELVKGVNQHEKRLDDLENFQTEQEKKNDAFTAKDGEQDTRLDAVEAKNVTQDAEIEETKASISELGNEVNSIAGRVTTNETEIANLKKSQTSQDEDISQLQEDVNNISQKNTAQDEEISNLKNNITAINEKDTSQDAEITQLKADVANAGKVDDVQVDGTSVVEDKVAKIPKVYTRDELIELIVASAMESFVPYENAWKDVNLGNRPLSAADITVGTPTAREKALLSNTFLRFVSTKKTDPRFINLSAVDDGQGEFEALRADSGESVLMNMRAAAPKVDDDLTTKKYVDNAISKIPSVDTSTLVPYVGATDDVYLDGHNIRVRNADDTTINTVITDDGVSVNDGSGHTSAVSAQLLSVYDSTGADASLDISQLIFSENGVAGGGAVKGLEAPTADKDAANKRYVDDKVNAPENYPHYIDIGIVLPKGTTVAAGDYDTEWWQITNPDGYNSFYESLPDGYDYHIVGITSLNSSPGSNLELGLTGIGTADGYEYPTMTVRNRTNASITTASAATLRFRMAYVLTKKQ